MKKKTTRKRLPDTKTQRWLSSEHACSEGRHRVGKMTLGEYWNTATNASDLNWLVRRMYPTEVSPLTTIYDSCKKIRASAEFQGRTMPIGLV